ncbi:MAG: PAS domain S-box protein [Bacteroides sp.]|jgi:PAS domain S-box-containing protein|nr:PAS domain S-box protein [Bacteroides sp.]
MNFIPESRLEELLNDKLDFLFILNMDGIIIDMNLAAITILGFSREELTHKHFLSAYAPNYREKMAVTLPLAIKGDVFSCPYPFVTRTGEIIPVDTKFYVGWWKGENVLVAVSTNLAVKYFSEEIFLSIFNGSQVMMAITAIDSNTVFNVNSAFLEMLGYSLGEVSGKTVRELGVYYNYSQRESMLRQFAVDGKAEGEATIKTKSGELLDCLLSFKRIKIQKDYYLLAAITNITRRKQMEEKLKHLNYQQKLLADVAQLLNKSDDFEGIINIVLRLVGQHSNVSRVYIFENTLDEQFTTNTYEWCNEGISGKKELFQMVPYTNVPSWKKILKEEGRIFSVDIKKLPQDIIDVLAPLNVKSLLAYPIYIQNRFWGFMGFDECVQEKVWLDDEVNLLLTVTNNVTNALERKLYLDQAKNSEMRLRMALNGAREGLWEWNLLTDKMFFTDACYTMLGYEADKEGRDRSWWEELIHPDDLPNVLHAFEEHLKRKTDYYESIFRVKDKAGEWRWILDHGKVVERDKSGNAMRAVGTHIDITKQKQVEEELHEMVVTKDNLFSIISHDLRGPVGNFMQIIELLTSDMDISPDMRADLLNELRSTSKNTFYLLENLLNWSRSQRSEIVCNPKAFIINELVAQNILLLSTAANQKTIDLQFDEKTNYEVYADYDMINLVVRNLLSNAIKFTRLSGTITISLSRQIEFVEVTIADNGVGMSEDRVSKLFTNNEFHSTYGTNNEKGSGLGLVLCKDFVSRNKGTIKAESVLGQGSRFIFTVPLSVQ